MILSAYAESIMLLAPLAESMILSVPPKGQWETPVAQWAAVRKAIALGNGTAVAQWTTQCHWSGSSDEVTFLYFRLVFFLLSKLPTAPDFCYSFGFSKLVVVGCTQSSTTCQNSRGLGKILWPNIQVDTLTMHNRIPVCYSHLNPNTTRLA
jgi:hypothetical protein